MAQVGALPGQATCVQLCGLPQTLLPACSVSAIDAESVTIACHTLCVTGRRPEGLEETMGNVGTNPLGAYFAEVARLEAASVDAFRILQGELAIHGAPRKLRRAAGRAARDEIRHARMTKALAHRFGSTIKPVVLENARQRSLEEIAVENAVEGCVRETYGALLATWQAQQASDAGIRAAMSIIAEDETRHAALSWSVARWLDRRLSSDERRRVEQARLAAVEDLLGHVEAANDVELLERAGLPGREQAALLVHHLAQALWS